MTNQMKHWKNRRHVYNLEGGVAWPPENVGWFHLLQNLVFVTQNLIPNNPLPSLFLNQVYKTDGKSKVSREAEGWTCTLMTSFLLEKMETVAGILKASCKTDLLLRSKREILNYSNLLRKFVIELHILTHIRENFLKIVRKPYFIIIWTTDY